MEGTGTQRKKVSVPGVIPEVITPAAEEYAKAKGIYGSLALAREIVRETVPSIRALGVDLKSDSDEGGYPTICFSITTPQSVESAVRSYDALQDAMFERVPADHCMYLSFTYQFV